MLVFIVRRLFVSIWVFLASTVVIFFLATNVRDPLADCQAAPDGTREAASPTITERMHLDEP